MKRKLLEAAAQTNAASAATAVEEEANTEDLEDMLDDLIWTNSLFTKSIIINNFDLKFSN